jgi:quercetin dioxygenase-like cupin family protein
MASPVTRLELLTALLDVEVSVSRVDIQEVTMAGGVKAPLHLHPCPTVGLITEGAISFQIEGQSVQKLKAGDAFYEPANVRIAKFDNDSDAPAKFVAFYLLGKDETETVRILES